MEAGKSQSDEAYISRLPSHEAEALLDQPHVFRTVLGVLFCLACQGVGGSFFPSNVMWHHACHTTKKHKYIGHVNWDTYNVLCTKINSP